MELALSLEAADHNLLDLESQKEGQVNAAMKEPAPTADQVNDQVNVVVHPSPPRKMPQTSQLGGRRSSSCCRCGGISHVNGGMQPAGFVSSEATYLLFARAEDEIGTINQCRVNTNFNQMAKIRRLTLLSTRCSTSRIAVLTQ